jgi:hypothetical protein
MKKIIIVMMTLTILLLAYTLPVHASYNYSPLMDVIYSAEALIQTNVIDTSNLVDTSGNRVSVTFGDLVDVFTYEDFIYITDSTQHKVYILDSQYRYVGQFGSGVGNNKLLSPRSTVVTKDYIYVADHGNQRIAVFNHQFEWVFSVLAPSDPTFKQYPEDPKGYDFRPTKVAVDKTGRIYAIADQIFEGILDFSPDGTFSRYVGANTVTLSLWDAFWLRLTSEEQRLAQGYRLATTFVNLHVDQKGYLYTVSSVTEGAKIVKKLNYKGIDVLSRNGYIPQVGDIASMPQNTAVPSGPSQFVDIDVNDFGNYMVLDRTRGRIFTYDFEGNLLYIAGQLGNIGSSSTSRQSLFLRPTSLTYFQDSVLVVDSMNKNLVVFQYTEFGRLVNEATKYYFEGEYVLAKQTWEQVLTLNTNYFLAYAGISKSELREGNFEQAMHYAKLGYDDITYSRAYQPYRYSQLVVIFPYIIGIGLAGLVFVFIKSVAKAVALSKEEEDVE